MIMFNIKMVIDYGQIIRIVYTRGSTYPMSCLSNYYYHYYFIKGSLLWADQ